MPPRLWALLSRQPSRWPRTKWCFISAMRFLPRHQPILVTIEAQSTAILKIELASDRSAETWEAHFKDLGASPLPQHWHGLRSGPLACGRLSSGLPRWHDGCVISSMSFKTFLTAPPTGAQSLCGHCQGGTKPRRHSTTPKARPICTSVSNNMNEPTTRVSTPWRRYDQLDLLLHLLREALHLCSPLGRLRTVEGVRSDLTLLLQPDRRRSMMP